MSRARRIGTAWETRVRDYLQDHGHPRVERMALGGTRDKGDLTGVLGWLTECKSLTRLDLGEALGVAERKAARFGLDPVVIFRRRGLPVGRAYAVMPLETWARLTAEDKGHISPPAA